MVKTNESLPLLFKYAMGGQGRYGIGLTAAYQSTVAIFMFTYGLTLEQVKQIAVDAGMKYLTLGHKEFYAKVEGRETACQAWGI